MERKFRLTQSAEIGRVRRNGKSYAHPLLVLIVLKNELEQPRVVVAAGRSVGGAVRRNRAKRRLRAAMQPMLTGLIPGWDVMLLARPPLVDADFREVQDALTALLRRARLWATPNGDDAAPA
ncbi:MAG: ribonuclease P protein component [Chloroflexi bacterium]|nr:ribonuclease P protein component [Chloroflexota bacterium]